MDVGSFLIHVNLKTDDVFLAVLSAQTLVNIHCPLLYLLLTHDIAIIGAFLMVNLLTAIRQLMHTLRTTAEQHLDKDVGRILGAFLEWLPVEFFESVIQSLIECTTLVTQWMQLAIWTNLKVQMHTRPVVVVFGQYVLLVNLTVIPTTLILVSLCCCKESLTLLYIEYLILDSCHNLTMLT